MELGPDGVWTKYLHDDVKRVGSGATAVTSWLHRVVSASYFSSTVN